MPLTEQKHVLAVLFAASAALATTLSAAQSGPAPAASQASTRVTQHHASSARAARRDPPPVAVREAPLTADEQAAQVLNRFTFGPRPGEVREVARTGWEGWFEAQLNPAAVPDATLDKRLAQYPALGLQPQQLAVQYPDGPIIRRIAEGKLAIPADAQLAGVYEVLLARYQRKQAQDKAEAAGGSPATGAIAASTSAGVPSRGGMGPVGPVGSGGGTAAAAPPAAATAGTADSSEGGKQARQKQQKEQDRAAARPLADTILAMPKEQRMAAILRLPVEQRMALSAGIAEPEKTMLSKEMTPHERELFGMMAGGYAGSGVIATEMQQAKVLRAVLSERQLLEVMTDFWFNHFNIDLGKSGDELDYAPSYERDAIRAHALGKFRDLLLATAEHPAMLIYLDNFQSVGPNSQAAGRPRPNAKNGAQGRGLNENYGREVMELHTLGVDGGYTQADVTSLAKILTGWTIDQPRMGGTFVFEPRRHEPGAKQWLGQKISEDGMNEGVRALAALAASPRTARHISYELAQRFVSDAPPPALIDRMTAAYVGSDGDIRTVLRTMVHAPEFWSRANYRTKVKMPLEYVASTLRATNTDPANPGALANELKTMGEPLYRCLPPTGYQATADHWMNSAALVDRLNYALQLTGGKFGGMQFDGPRLVAAGLLSRPATAPAVGPSLTRAVAVRSEGSVAESSGQDEALSLMERLLVPGEISGKTNAVIREEVGADTSAGSSSPGGAQAAVSGGGQIVDPSATLDRMAAMILGSPEFQMH